MESPPTPPPEPPGSGPHWRAQWHELRADITAPRPVPRSGRLALVRYGLAQPFLGLRIVLRSPDLFGIALAPMIGVLLVAGVVAYGTATEHGPARGVLAFMGAVAALAPLPMVLFGRVYALLAAKARGHLGLPPQGPYRRGLVQLAGEWVAQVIVLAAGVVPLLVFAWLIPFVGHLLVPVVQGGWTLHWIVVEGYDNARTLPPGCTVAQLEAEAHHRPGLPWFHRWHTVIDRPAVVVALLTPLRMLSEVVAALARPWRREVDLVEERPWISLGFGLGAIAMLAVPGLNLLLRPAVVVAGVHLRHRLLDEPGQDPAQAPTGAPAPPDHAQVQAPQHPGQDPRAAPGGTQPYPTVPPSA